MLPQWWSEVAPGELRFQCSFKRPSIEAVDEVVKRMSGDSLGLVDCGVCDILPEESLESTVHRLSIDMEAAGRQPSMEELAAGVAIVAANNSQGSPWCEERLEMLVQSDREIPWDRSSKRHNRTIIPAALMDMDDDDEQPEPRRRSIGKDSTESADLDWLRESSSAAIEALRGARSWRAPTEDAEDEGAWPWQPTQLNGTLNSSPTTKRTTIKAQPTEQ
eukprot:TRINITY_DN2491_c0_g1_i3.p2 TRINITY_DN2491_c0_g1~~TRINITY_DN2491_c0_g1_i3.p2  ORF type:complete len:219 (-),score=29.93 TRINITY_DN2491_c0_g1_i3:204-860(-)